MTTNRWLGSSVATAMAVLAVGLHAQDSQPAGPPPEVKVVSLTVQRPDGDEARFTGRASLAVRLRITCPDREVLGIDDEASLLTAFTDDRGTDLRPAKERLSAHGGARMRGSLSASSSSPRDRSSTTLELAASKPPAEDATRLKIRATLVIKCGTDNKTVRTQPAALKAGTALEGGPMPLKIARLEDAKWGDGRFLLTLEGQGSDEAIREVRLLDGTGQVLKAQSYGSGRMSGPDGPSFTRSYSINEQPEKLAVEITYFERIERVEAPVDLEFGLGLEPKAKDASPTP